jgi:hypothetical protein
MKHFYKLVEGNPNLQVMNELIPTQFDITALNGLEEFVVRKGEVDEPFGDGKPLVGHDLKQMAIGVMQLVGGVALASVVVLRVAPKTNVPLTSKSEPYRDYVVVMHAEPGATLMAGGEAVNLRSGHVWWADLQAAESQLVNNSADEVIIMLVHVKVDP